MPYSNVPENLWGKMDDCVKEVMDKQGYEKERAIGICHASIVGKHSIDPNKEEEKESKEHPTLPESTVKQIVWDHMNKEKKAKLKKSWKILKAKHLKKTIASHWKKAKMSGLSSIPTDYTKRLDGQNYAKHSHGQDLPKTAVHGIGMDKYTTVDVRFLREGDFRTNGVPYHYDWETIERDGKTFEGKGFFANHDEVAGKEMGIIDKVYTAVHEGERWLCATVKIPEADWTKPFIERIQTGLIHDVSSTHDFYVDPDDPQKRVSKLVGRGLSAVKEGEVSGAKVVELKRNLKNN